MAVLQIIYFVINIVGVIAGLIYFASDTECYIFSDIFTFIHRYFKNVGLAIITLLLITLLLPAITFITVAISFITVYDTYSDQEN